MINTRPRAGDIQEVQQLLMKLASTASAIETRSVDALRRIEASAATLHQGAQRLEGGAERVVQEVMQAIGQGSQAAVAKGAQQALDQFDRQLKESARQAELAARTLGEQSRAVNHAQRVLIWKGLIALIVGSLLAAGGSAYVGWSSLRDVRQAEFGTAILRATQSGMLTACGKDQALCVKVGEKPRRAGERGEYMLVGE